MDERDPRHPLPQYDGAAPQFAVAPSMQQFQQAGAGYVLPGASSGQPPMASNGGFIGNATPQGTLPAPSGQAWGFPTPQGLQLVQHGAAPTYQQAPQQQVAPQAYQPAPPVYQQAAPHVQFQPMQPPMAQPQQAWLEPVAGAGTATAVVVAPQRMGRRVRWETIVPAIAIMCFMVAVGLFIADFDSITGRATAPEREAAAAVDPSTGAPDQEVVTGGGAPEVLSTADAKVLLAEAQVALKQGNFEQATATLQPLLDAEQPLPAVTRLAAQVTAASKRNTVLLTKLTRQQAANDWQGIATTLTALGKVRPLSPALAADLRQARAKVQLAKSKAAAKARTASPSRAATQQAPAAGGAPSTPTAAKPPANVPTTSIPSRPDAPKPANTGGGGAAPAGVPTAPSSNPGSAPDSMPGMVM